MKNFAHRTCRILLVFFIGYVVLVGTHAGEFWPFSIYPMFSTAGRTWTRVQVRSDTGQPNATAFWQPRTADELPGLVFPLDPAGIGQNDLSNLVEKTEVWDAPRRAALQQLFAKPLERGPLLLYRVRGRKSGDTEKPVAVTFTPLVWMRADTMIFNPTR